MFLDTCLSVLEIAEKATKLFDWFTGVSAGERMSATVNQLEKNKTKIERLSDNILYASSFQQAISLDGNNSLREKKEIFRLINPIAEALETEVLASAVIETPEKLKKAFKKDPWELLDNVRPVNRTRKPSNPDLVPVSFMDEGIQYVGWTMRAALPILFNCEFEYNGNLFLPADDKSIIRNKGARRKQEESHEDDNPIEKLIEELLRWFNSHLSKNDFFVYPNIPDQKFSNALEKFETNHEDLILAFIDCTIFGSGSDFLAFGVLGIYFHNDWSGSQPGFHFIPYGEFPKRRFWLSQKHEIALGADKYLNPVGSGLDRKDILHILNGVKQIISKHVD